MNNLMNELSQLKKKMSNNKHLRIGLPFIIAIGMGPTLMKSFVEIQYVFGRVEKGDNLNDELNKKKFEKRSQEDILQQMHKELIEDRKELLDNWEPVRVNRWWEEHDDTFKSLITKEELTLKD